MKVGFLIQTMTPGGAERATAAIASELAGKGENTEIITFDSSESFYPLENDVEVVNMELRNISKSASLKRLIGCIKRAFEIRRKIKARKLDVLVCMSSTMNLYGLLSTIFTSTKAVGTERSNPYKYKADKINAFLKKLSARLLDGFVFQTKTAADYYPESVRQKGVVIQNAVFNPLVREIEPTETEERQKIIYGVGRMSSEKRFGDLIDAYVEVEKNHPDYRLVIFGDGVDREKLEEKVASLSCRDKILLPGADKNALKFVAKGSVFVLSSEYEGMPNALMEAMAVGTPCVSTRCKIGPEELIEDGANGLLVPVGDVKKLSAGIEMIIDNPVFARILSYNGRNILKTNDISTICSEWLEYLNSVK